MIECQPLVSVICPNYNHLRFLPERLKTIREQSHKNIELIVIDDASTDGSQEYLLSKKAEIDNLLLNEKNSGSPFPQWQKGLSISHGKYVWIAESDDACRPDFLEKLLAKMDDTTGLAYAQSLDVSVNGDTIGDRIDYTSNFDSNIWKADFKISGRHFCNRYLKSKNVIPNASAVVFRRDIVSDSTFCDELINMTMCGDWLFWIRVVQKTNIAFVAEHLNFFREHVASSRIHRGYDKIAKRILEEATIRAELSNFENVNQQNELKCLKEKWFDIHKISECTSDKFLQLNRKRLFAKFQASFISHKISQKIHPNR